MYKTEAEFAAGEAAAAPLAEKAVEGLPRTTADFLAGMGAHIDAVARARQHYSLEKLRRAPLGSGFAEMGEAEQALSAAARAFAEETDDASVYAIARELQARYELFAQNSDGLDDRLLDSQKEEALHAASRMLLSIARERRSRS